MTQNTRTVIKYLRFGLLFTAILVCCNFAHSQVPKDNTLIIQVPGITADRGMPLLKQKIEALPGCKLYAFCKMQTLLLVILDLKDGASPAEVFEAIQNEGFRFSVKDKAPFERVLLACNDCNVYFRLPKEDRHE